MAAGTDGYRDLRVWAQRGWAGGMAGGGHGTGVVGGRWWEPHQLLVPAAETTGGNGCWGLL